MIATCRLDAEGKFAPMRILKGKDISTLDKTKLNKRERVVFFFFVWFTLQYITIYYIGIGLMPRIYIYINVLLAFLFPVYDLVAGRNRNGRIRFNNRYEMAYTILFIFLLALSVIYGVSHSYVSRTVVCIAMYMQVLCALLYKDLRLHFFEVTFKWLAIISVFGTLLVAAKMNIDISFAVGRGYQYSEIFYYAGLFWASGPFLILAFIRNRKILIGAVYFGVNIILNLIIVKRMIIADTMVIVLVVLFILASQRGNSKKMFKVLALVATLFIIVFCLAGSQVESLFDSVFKRTMTVTDNLSAFDRFIETQNFFDSSNIFQLLFGGGFSATHSGLGEETEALHVGWAHFILKGGVLLLALAIIPYFKLIPLIKKFDKLTEKKQFAVCYLLYQFPLLFISTLHVFYPRMFLFFFCCIEVMSVTRQNCKKKF